jgi:putative ABC transport system permease protein
MLQTANSNLLGGAVNQGTAQIHQQVIFRPTPGLARAETPIGHLFLAGASAHPGGGVHGAAGANAARAALRPTRVVSEALARRFFPEGGDVGGHIVIDDKDGPLEVVGVAADVKDEDIEEEPELGIYIPYRQDPWWKMGLVVRAQGDPSGLAPLLREEVRALDRDLPVYNVRTMQTIIDETLSPKRLAMFMFAFFAVCALVLAAVGIYAVMSYAVTQRTHEIGVRMALGAQARDIFRLVVGHGVVLTLVGVGLGAAGAVVLTQLMSTLLFEVKATDPLAFAGGAAVLIVTALVACYVPARRAMKVDPMTALRYE